MEVSGSEHAELDLSVVIPCFNESAVLAALRERLSRALKALDVRYEVLLVDDGSSDATWSEMQKIHAADPRWKALQLSRNFGHQTAVSAGLWHCNGAAVMILDADLQDPPELIAQFVAKWREGNEVVFGVRRKRKEGPAKRLSYHLFYRLLAALAETEIPLDSGDFCLMDRRVVNVLNAMPERNRFVRGLRAWTGFRQVGIEYERDARAAGEPKYSFRKLVKLAVDGLFSFSTVPLRLSAYLGFAVSGLSLLGVAFTLIQRLFAAQFAKIGLAPVPGFATIVIAVLFLGGVQLVCLGILGEYVGRIYDEVRGRPKWVIGNALGTLRAYLPPSARAHEASRETIANGT